MTNRSWQRTPEAFTERIEQILPWITSYMKCARGPWSPCQPGEIRDALPWGPPESPESLEVVMDDLQRVIEPGMVRWDAPGWFAWFPCNCHPDALLGDLISGVTAQQGMMWASSPACTELEVRMLEWMRQALGLPDVFKEGGAGGGVIQDTASSGVLACMVAARDRATEWKASELGGPACTGLTAYASEQAHSSVLKAAGICGIGRSQLRLVPTDDQFRMRPDALAAMMEADVNAGLTPCFCVATVGTTGCGSFDPVEPIAGICESHGCWLHVDAAWAGTAALAEIHRSEIIAGAEGADSWSFNPHKWMGASFDCSLLWLADRAPLNEAMSIHPEYLRNQATDSGQVIDYRDWHVQLGRRFRAIKLWLLLRCTGLDALAEMVRTHVSMAIQLEQAIASASHLELAAPRSLSLLCVQHQSGDEATQRLIDAVNNSGQFAVTHCALNGRLAMRIAVGAAATDEATIKSLASLLLTSH